MRLRSKLLIAFIVFMTAVVAPVATFVVIGCFDTPPPDDADLRPERPEEVPDDQNALPLLREAYAAMFRLNWGENLDGTTTPEDAGEDVLSDAERLDYMFTGEKWDDAAAEEYLRRNRKALDLLDEALARPHIQLPYVDSASDELTYLYKSLHLGVLIQFESRVQAHRGEAAKAYETAMQVLHLSDRLERANNGLAACLVGQTIRGLGTELLRDYAATCPLPPEDMRAYAKRLNDLPLRGEDLAHALRVDYIIAANTVDEVRAHGIEKWAPWCKGPEWAFASSPYRLHPNRTKGLFAQTLRAYTAAARKPYWEAKPDLEDLACRLESHRDQTLGHWWGLLRPNAVGEFLFCEFAPSLSNSFHVKANNEVQCSVTRLLLLLRAYQDERGRLPDTLDALVPAYLDAVPVDPFDGKPMRYDPQKRILYSVGEDGVDGGGLSRDEQERWWKAEEPDWAEEEPLPPPERMPDPSYLIEF